MLCWAASSLKMSCAAQFGHGPDLKGECSSGCPSFREKALKDVLTDCGK